MVKILLKITIMIEIRLKQRTDERPLVVNRPGFDSLVESDQKTLKVGIHSFPASRSA